MSTAASTAPVSPPSPGSSQRSRPRLRRWAIRAGAAFLVLAAALWGLFEWFAALQNRNVTSGIAIGEGAPDFALSDQTGRVRSLRDLGGPKGLLLVFVRSADW